MCTMTIIPTAADAMRMAVNRDESRTRAAALPPVVRQFGPRRAILPIDPVGGGTWVAVSDAGLAFTLLNRSLDDSMDQKSNPGLASRGLIIPLLLGTENLTAVFDLAQHIDVSQYNPFRLVITNGRQAIELFSDGRRWDRVESYDVTAPLMFTSSGLGDQVVEGPRRQLFNDMFQNARPEEWTTLQDAFQRHSWPDRLHHSVCMSRAEARTVSLTSITLRPDRIALTYHGDAPDRATGPVTITLPRAASVAA
jgi:hypothetical protein